MLNHQAAPVQDRRAPTRRQPSWLDRWAPGIFVAALALCAVSFVRFVNDAPEERRPKTKMKNRAHAAVDVFSLHRAPTVAAGAFRYAVLGYGQDAGSGDQIVWVRSLTTNRVGGFKEGQRLFEGPVQVASIESERLVLSYRGEDFEAPIQP